MVASVWHLAPSAWTAIAAWTGVGGAGVGALIAAKQLGEARSLRRQQAQPYVVVFLDPSGTGPHSYDLVIKNLGRTAAHEVRVVFSGPLESAALREKAPECSPIGVPEVIPVLVPGQEWRTFWDLMRDRAGSEDLPSSYTATVTFKDFRGKTVAGTYIYVLDWSVLIARGTVEVFTLHNGVEALRELSKVLKSANTRKGLNVVVRDGDRLDARQRAHYAARMREEPATEEEHLAHPARLADRLRRMVRWRGRRVPILRGHSLR